MLTWGSVGEAQSSGDRGIAQASGNRVALASVRVTPPSADGHRDPLVTGQSDGRRGCIDPVSARVGSSDGGHRQAVRTADRGVAPQVEERYAGGGPGGPGGGRGGRHSSSSSAATGRSARRPPRWSVARHRSRSSPPGPATSSLAPSGSVACGTALDAIRSGRPRRLDLGRGALVGGRWRPARQALKPQERLFTVACGMGLDARIMAAAEHEWKRRLRFGAYVGAAVRELTAPRAVALPDRGRRRDDRDRRPPRPRRQRRRAHPGPDRSAPADRPDRWPARAHRARRGRPARALQGAAALMLVSGRSQRRGHPSVRSRDVTIEADPLQPIETTATITRRTARGRASSRAPSRSSSRRADVTHTAAPARSAAASLCR